MAKSPSHHRQPWTPSEVARMRELAAGNTPTRVIGVKLGRTEAAVRGQAAENRIPLRPWNQSPYGSRGRRRS